MNYEPNSFGGPVEDPAVKEPPLKISGDADRYDHRVGNDDYHAGGKPVPSDERGAEEPVDWKHCQCDENRSHKNPGAPGRSCLQGRSRLRRRFRQRTGFAHAEGCVIWSTTRGHVVCACPRRVGILDRKQLMCYPGYRKKITGKDGKRKEES